MKQTNNPTQKKTLTLNKVIVSSFTNNVVKTQSGKNQFLSGQSLTCVPTSSSI
jgi:hypothetical protein